MAKNCWGIIADDLDETAAAKLAEHLRAESLDAVVVASGDIAVPAKAESIVKLEPADDAWRVFSKTGEAFSVNTGQISLISAVVFEEVSVTTTEVKDVPGLGRKAAQIGILLTTGLPIPLGGSKTTKKTERKSNQFIYVDLFIENPNRRFRIDAHEFDYRFLKERMTYNLMSNLKSLLADLVKASPCAGRNFGAGAIMRAEPVHQLGYGSLADGERECRWLLNIRNLPENMR
ncbi:MAG: hypothetical protein HY747_09740 [Elusimicrobia bacterium]|nr:hypothetical protein [Elusimicrobiota bacterium]